MGRNPLEGISTASGPAFVDLSRTYRKDLQGRWGERLKARGLGVSRGILAAFPGPSYETPAEVRMARTLGASVVGMSTVPEAVWARFLGLDVLAAARVSNLASGLGREPLSHAEVVREMERGAGEAEVVVEEAIKVWKAEG
jgi:purine-nucleoside phosphorylase